MEFLSYDYIAAHYGKDGISGITEYSLNTRTGTALFSDDTQMTLFTASGILVNETGKRLGNTDFEIETSMVCYKEIGASSGTKR